MADWLENIEESIAHLRYFFVSGKVSVVVPCYNEEKTVAGVVKACKESRFASEIVVVDDGSADRSAERARLAGARVIRHRTNKGKAIAIKTGAAAAKNEAMVFIDADLETASPDMVDELALPLLEGRASISKARFSRSQGRVTELTAKPLLRNLYPEIDIDQPLSGQFAITKTLLGRIELAEGWGVDVGIVIDAYALGERIEEVDIGELEHKHRPLDQIAKTSLEVTQTILRKAGFTATKHKLIVFDFDRTLVEGSSIEVIAREHGFWGELAMLRKMYHARRISERDLCRRLSAMLCGMNANTLAATAKKLKVRHFAREALTYLKRMGYSLAVVSFAYKRVILAVFGQDFFSEIVCPELEQENGKLTGKVRIPPYTSPAHVFDKSKAVRMLMKKFKSSKDRTVAVGDSSADEGMFKAAGTSACFGSAAKLGATYRIKALSEVIIIAS